MQKDLVSFCEKVKSMWFLVKLDTNGRDPKILKELIDKNLVDYIAMDIKHEIWKFNLSAGIEIDEKPYIESINLLLNSSIDYEFRTTVIDGVHSLETIENISKSITWAKNYFLQNYSWWNTLDPKFDWKSFSPKKLEESKNIATKYVKNVWIRF